MSDEHRLAAIVFTDILGYTRKMGSSEQHTMQLLEIHNSMVEPVVRETEGQIIKTIGDAYMIQFDSALKAVECALKIQEIHRKYNEGKKEEDQILIRIGIHLGDITFRDDDVFGSGVNIASRVEPKAEPGGICITRTVYESIKSKIDLKVIYLGPQELKNVDYPVALYYIITGGEKKLPKPYKAKTSKKQPLFIRFLLPSILLIVVAVAIALFMKREKGVAEPSMPDLPPSANRVAVLPLRNLSGDESKEYLCEGISENVIFSMLNFKNLYVYSIDNILQLGKEEPTLQEMRDALGVNYLVTGRLYIVDDNLMIDMETTEAATGKRLLNERYLDSMDKRLQMQEKIARDVAFSIVGKVAGEDSAMVIRYGSSNGLANEFYLKARHAYRNATNWPAYQSAISLYEGAVSADTTFALARAHLAVAYAGVHGAWKNDPTWLEKANKEAGHAVALSEDLPEAHFALGKVKMKQRDYDTAESQLRKAIELRPNFLEARYALSSVLAGKGKAVEAQTLIEQINQISRETGNRLEEAKSLIRLALSHGFRGDESALDLFERSLRISQEINYRLGEGEAYQYIGVFYANRFMHDKALENYNRAISIYRELGAYQNACNAHLQIGQNLALACNFREAEENLEDSIQLAKEIGDDGKLATGYYVLGWMKTYQGDYHAAELNLDRAVVIVDSLENQPLKLIFLTRICQNTREAGNLEKADSALLDAIQMMKQHNLSGLRKRIMLQSALNNYESGQYQASLDTLTALESLGGMVWREIPHLVNLYKTADRIRLGIDSDNGIEQMNSSLQSLIDLHSPFDIISAYRLLAETDLFLGNHEAASEYIEKGLAMADEKGIHGQAARLKALAEKI